MLEVKGLMTFCENALAVNDLSIRVEAGQVLGVIVSNSAGKTTLMNTLSDIILDQRIKELRKGDERITIVGQVIFEGADINDMSAYERVRLGIVLCRERHQVFHDSTVLENLAIASHLRSKVEVSPDHGAVLRVFP